MIYFTIKELCKSQTAQSLGLNNSPTLEVQRNLKALVDEVLDPVRIKFGKPIIVNSGYRAPKVNKAVGGAHNSQHVKGEAADITAKNPADNAELWRIILELGKYDQVIWEKGNSKYPAWVHVSFSRLRNRKQRLKYNGYYYERV